MPSYKLTFGDRVLTYPGHAGYVGYGMPLPIQRYEYSLYHNADGIGASAGSLASAASGFDQLIVGVGWQDGRATHGIEYNYFNLPKTDFALQHYFSNGSNFYLFESRLDIDNANKTWQISANTANYWGLTTPQTTTAALTQWNCTTARLRCVTDIIGVKYQ